jgi:hypothetical protein
VDVGVGSEVGVGVAAGQGSIKHRTGGMREIKIMNKVNVAIERKPPRKLLVFFQTAQERATPARDTKKIPSPRRSTWTGWGSRIIKRTKQMSPRIKTITLFPELDCVKVRNSLRKAFLFFGSKLTMYFMRALDNPIRSLSIWILSCLGSGIWLCA